MIARNLSFTVLAASMLASVPAVAHEAGDWILRAGVWTVAPKSDNNDIVEVDDGISLGINAVYMFTDQFGFEVLASTPFSHDITLKADGSTVGETKHLPPTFSAQYYMPVSDGMTAYVGAGLNWTIFFDEETSGALAGADLELDDSIGLSLQLGADFDISDTLLFNIDIRYIDIDTDASVDGDELENTVEIDPWVLGLNLGWKF